jgi:hypothetical protein
MLACYEKEVMKPTRESIDYACSVEQYKSPFNVNTCMKIAIALAVVVLVLDMTVWRT